MDGMTFSMMSIVVEYTNNGATGCLDDTGYSFERNIGDFSTSDSCDINLLGGAGIRFKDPHIITAETTICTSINEGVTNRVIGLMLIQLV